jgi:hypothetical protein
MRGKLHIELRVEPVQLTALSIRTVRTPPKAGDSFLIKRYAVTEKQA